MSEQAAADRSSVGVKGEVTMVEPDRHERSVARRSAEARAIVPNVEHVAVVDMETALRREASLRCGMTALLVGAAARALRALPRVNGAYRDGHYELYSRVNVGVTIAEPGIYVIPTVFDADRKSLGTIAAELAEYIERARAGTLTPGETTGATFTLSDAVGHDVATLTPLIIPPQAAALAAGPVRNVPVIRGGTVVPGHTMALTLACDHRIVYGAHAAMFLEQMKAHLEEAMA